MTQSAEPVQAEGMSSAAVAALAAAFSVLVAAELSQWLQAASKAVLTGLRWNLTAFRALDLNWTRRVDGLMPDLVRAARAGWEETATQLGMRDRFDPSDPLLLDQLARTRNLLVQIDDEVYRMVIRAIADGTDAGEDQAAIAARIDNILSWTGSVNWPNRADVIARTEVTRFTEVGALAAARRYPRPLLKVWKDRDDSSVRRAHEAIDGHAVGLYARFEVGMSMLNYPADPSGLPHDVINCVTGDALVSCALVEAAFRFQWNGPVLTLRRKSGLISTVSINHPVVTNDGWIQARLLKKGSHLICARFSDDFPRSNPRPDGGPPTAEELFGALSLANVPQRVVPLAVNFHGDTPHGDVEVVFADRKLSFGVPASAAEQFDQFCLTCSDLPASTDSPGFEFTQRSANTTNGIVGTLDLKGSDFAGHLTPFQKLGFTATPDGDASPLESPTQGGPADIQSIGQSLHRGSVQVFLDEIIEVVEHDFSGHLYTFQTASGIYMADATVSHNCRCHLMFRSAR